MKNLMLATVAAAVSFAGFAQDATAGHHPNRRNVGLRIAGAVLNEVFVGSSRPIARPHHYHVTYHMHGSRRLHFHSHSSAHRYEEYLESLGVHARLIPSGGSYDVVYHMDGRRRRSFSSDYSAHAFERRLKRLGIDATVEHR